MNTRDICDVCGGIGDACVCRCEPASGSLHPAVGGSALFGELVRKHQLAVETLTEQQLAEAIRQAIASGDFMRNVVHDRHNRSAQSVTYIPWLETERLKTLYNELLYAVASKHEGETRHETALRYIRERESQVISGSVEISANPFPGEHLDGGCP